MASSQSDIRREIYERIGRIAVAISSPSRLKLIQLLAQGPRTVESLSHESGESIANTSQHLQRLLREKLVNCKKVGVSRVYKLDNPYLLRLWEDLQDLAHEVAPELNEAEAKLTDASLRSERPTEEWLRMVKKKKAVLIDVREIEESGSTPVRNALRIPLKDLLKRKDELPRNKPIIVLCRGRYCSLASKAVRALRKEGFDAYRLRESAFRISKLWEVI